MAMKDAEKNMTIAEIEEFKKKKNMSMDPENYRAIVAAMEESEKNRSEASKKRVEESKVIAERLVARYEQADASEYAARSYMLSLDPATRSFIRADRPMRMAMLAAFYGAKSQEELDALITKKPDELAEIGKGGCK